MNFIIVTQFDPIYIKSFFSTFFQIYDKTSHKLKGIVIQPSLNKTSSIALGKQILRVFGPKFFSFLIYRHFLEKIGDRFRFPNIKSLRGIIDENNIPILDIVSVNTDLFYNIIISQNIDLVVSVSASEIFKRKILKLPKYGCINLHNAPLPRYKGMMPNFWQMLHGEKYSILTIHRIMEDIDAGMIILQDKTAIKDKMSLHGLMLRTKRKSAHSLIKAIDMIEMGNVSYIDNDRSQSTYFSFPTREDVINFRKQGKIIL